MRVSKKCILIIYILNGAKMEASIVDLRYKMKDVLKALGRHERVKILYHGKVRGTIIPDSKEHKRKVAEHEFFGMKKDMLDSVEDMMGKLRGGRYNAV
jgi:hypothetical protein